MRLPILLATLGIAALALPSCDSNTDAPPRRAIVTAVQIDDAPLRDPENGDEWDGTGGGGPEVYFRLLYADESPTSPGVLNPRDDDFVLNTTGPNAWAEDVDGGDFPLVWSVGGGFEVRSLSDEYRIVLYDYDPLGEDDVMILTRTFRFSEQAPTVADGREDVIILDGVGADETLVRVRLRVRYER